MEQELNKAYWDARYTNNQTGWDVGEITPPLKSYIDQLTDTSLNILIPGAGNAYEAEHLLNKGFTGTHVLDISGAAIAAFKKRVPDFPTGHLHEEDFFQHQALYDLILEQTFFCALHPSLRLQYAHTMHRLLKPGGRLVGLLFNDTFEGKEDPPFGGTRQEYALYFQPYFDIRIMDVAYNSIKPRNGRELFILLLRKQQS